MKKFITLITTLIIVCYFIVACAGEPVITITRSSGEVKAINLGNNFSIYLMPNADPIVCPNRTYYTVGKDVYAGEYVCYKNRIKVLDKTPDGIRSGELEPDSVYAILLGENHLYYSEKDIFSVRDGECVVCDGDAIFIPIDEAEFDYKTPGMYLVGTHMDAGQYTFQSTDKDYIGRIYIYSDAQKSDEVKKEFWGKQSISVADGEYLKYSSCEIINYSPNIGSSSIESEGFDQSTNTTLTALEVQYNLVNYIGCFFNLKGVATLSDYYNYGYGHDIEDENFCVQIIPDDGNYLNRWYIYCSREEFSGFYQTILSDGEVYCESLCVIPPVGYKMGYQEGQGCMARMWYCTYYK